MINYLLLAIIKLRSKAVRGLLEALLLRFKTKLIPRRIYYYIWIKKHEPKGRMLEFQRDYKFNINPKISIIVPTFNTPRKFLVEMIDSVLMQTYSNWELCIADGGSKESYVKNILEEYVKKDMRMKKILLGENRGIAGNSNAALSLATGDFIALLDHDDLLAPFALFEIVKQINEHPEADFLYSDEDKISEDGKNRSNPHFKPDWSPDTMLSYNYLCHLSVIRKSIVDEVQGFREGYDGSQDYDLFLRVFKIARKIVHVPKILYHWRTHQLSVAQSGQAKIYAIDSGKRAIMDYLSNCDYKASVSDGIVFGTYRVSYEIKGCPKVSIIIPSKDKTGILKACISSILDKTDYPNYQIIIVDNLSEEKDTYEYYRHLKDYCQISIIHYNKPFNYSAINNYAVSQIETDHLLFLNNDTEIINANWITSMLEHAQRREVGAVGAKLYYPNDTIQHAGVIVGLGGVAGHSHKHFSKDASGYFYRPHIIQNLSAVTGACMMMRSEIFAEVDGFDERYSHAFNDIDLCLKIRERGYLIIYTPYAELYHHESLTRGYEGAPEKLKRFQKEIKLFKEKWGHILERVDIYYNPNLTLNREDFSLKI